MPGWNPSFYVQGQVCPLIGSLRPLPSEAPKFLQVYFIDSQVEEILTRMHITSGMKQNIAHELSAIFHHENQYVRHFKTAQELFLSHATSEGWKAVIYEEKWPRTEHARRFN